MTFNILKLADVQRKLDRNNKCAVFTASASPHLISNASNNSLKSLGDSSVGSECYPTTKIIIDLPKGDFELYQERQMRESGKLARSADETSSSITF
jgi:hypothetical protein